MWTMQTDSTDDSWEGGTQRSRHIALSTAEQHDSVTVNCVEKKQVNLNRGTFFFLDHHKNKSISSRSKNSQCHTTTSQNNQLKICDIKKAAVTKFNIPTIPWMKKRQFSFQDATVRALPPRQLRSSCVSFESRYLEDDWRWGTKSGDPKGIRKDIIPLCLTFWTAIGKTCGFDRGVGSRTWAAWAWPSYPGCFGRFYSFLTSQSNS